MDIFVRYFLATAVVASVGILFILLAKKGFKKHMTARWRYNLGLLFFVFLSVPLVPAGFFAQFNVSGFVNIRVPAPVTDIAGNANALAYATSQVQDFAVQEDNSVLQYWPMVFFAVWLAGMVAAITVILLCNKKLRQIKASAVLADGEMLSLFARCKAEVGVRSNILLSRSVLVKTPITVGIFRPQIILPAIEISAIDTKYALLHELAHCKNRDVQINALMCLFQILYWFNPLVHLAFRQMRMDRELACDADVLEILPQESRIGYGKTLLSYSLAGSSMQIFAAEMGGRKPQLFVRVGHIASYSAATAAQKAKSVCAFILMCALVLCTLPIAAVFADNRDTGFHFQAENVQYSDLSAFFGNISGSFVLYDVAAGLYTIHNRDMATVRVSPTSTYKIVSALVALETGVLDAGNTVRQWDGTPHPFDAWGRGHNLDTAMSYSVNWYFQELDAQVGVRIIRTYLELLQYGNYNTGGGPENFWNNSSLRISPVEQVAFLRNLHHGETMFAPQHVATVMDAMRLGNGLYGKTGTGIVDGRAINGWFVGIVESDSGTFAFATYIEGPDSAGGSVAAQITQQILEYMGVL